MKQKIQLKKKGREKRGIFLPLHFERERERERETNEINTIDAKTGEKTEK